MNIRQRILHHTFAAIGLGMTTVALAAGGPNSASLDKAQVRASLQPVSLQCRDADGSLSAAACAPHTPRQGKGITPGGNGTAIISNAFADTDCVSTNVVFDIQAQGAEMDGGSGLDRMYVVVFDDGTIEFSGFFDVPLGPPVVGTIEFSYPDPNIGNGAPGIGLYIFTRTPFDSGGMNELTRVDPLVVQEETNCQSLAPVVDLSLSSSQVQAGQPVSITWQAQRTQGTFPCIAFEGQGTPWPDEALRPAVGLQTFAAPMSPGQVEFAMECQGANGLLGEDRVVLNVTSGGTAPMVQLDANPGRTSPGGVINLEWTSTAPREGFPCLPAGGQGTNWARLGQLPANGRRSVAAPANAGTIQFQLTCSSGSLSGNDVTQVIVASSSTPPPSVQPGATSLTANGTTAAGTSIRPSLNRDGSALVFETSAENISAILPSGAPYTDANGKKDIFLITSAAAVTGSSAAKGAGMQAVLCSLDENGPLTVATTNPRLAATGAGATFESDDGQIRTFLGGLGRTSGATSSAAPSTPGALGTPGNGVSANPDINQDATAVVFDSTSTNLVGFDTNNVPDIFMKDPMSGAIEMISVGAGGEPANGPSTNPSISADGRTVFFQTEATNMDGLEQAPARRAKGSVLQVCGSTANDGLGRTRGCASVDPITGQPGDGPSRNVRMSQTGEFGVFESEATNLVENDTNGVSDVFWFSWDGSQATGVVRVSTGANGEQANGASRMPSISDDGMTVTFESDATNLVTPDGNGQTDAFIKYVMSGQIQRFATTGTGGEPNGSASQVVVSGDGSTVAFASDADNILPGDANDRPDVFVAPNPQVLDANEPALLMAALPLPNPPNPNCSAGYFTAVIDDGPGPGVQPGIFGGPWSWIHPDCASSPAASISVAWMSARSASPRSTWPIRPTRTSA
ncbi:MAG: hypothetical protein R3F15_02970 [Lysobacterales bacterium]